MWTYYYAEDSSGSGMSCGTVIPTVNVYFSGTLANTYVLTNGFTPGQAWHVANISVNGAQLTASAGATSPVSGGSEPCVGE